MPFLRMYRDLIDYLDWIVYIRVRHKFEANRRWFI